MKHFPKRRVKFALLIVLLAALVLVAKFTPIAEYIDKDKITSMVEDAGIYGPLIFILVYMVATITFLPGTPLTLVSGVLFGLKGGFYVIIGATLGATIAFFIARFFGGDFVEKILKDKFKKLYEYDEKIEKNGLLVMLFLRFIPLFPFNGLNFAMGLTKIKARDYMIGTFFGIIPGTLIYVNVGSSAASGITSPQFLLSLGLLGLLILTLPIYNYVKKKYSRTKS